MRRASAASHALQVCSALVVLQVCALTVAAPCTAGECCAANQTVLPAGTVCRTARGPCDISDVCDGTSPHCPADLLRPQGFMCRNASGMCDSPEFCTGTSATCPGDARLGWGNSSAAVDLDSSEFSPATLQVAIGDTLVIRNTGPQVQPITSNCTVSSSQQASADHLVVPVGGDVALFVNATSNCTVSRLDEAVLAVQITYSAPHCALREGNATHEVAACPNPYAKASGWLRISVNGTCEDINECASAALHSCNSTAAICVNTPGSHVCQCAYGTVGNGTHCERRALCGADANVESEFATTDIVKSLHPPESGVPRQSYGTTVAVSDDGTTVVVGACCQPTPRRTGHVYVYERAKGQNASFTQWGRSVLGDTHNDKANGFGYSVAVAGDGARVFVGSLYPLSSPRRAAVYAYTRSNAGAWTEDLARSTEFKLLEGTMYFGVSHLLCDASGETLAVLGTTSGNWSVVLTMLHWEPAAGWSRVWTLDYRSALLGAFVAQPGSGSARDLGYTPSYTSLSLSRDGKAVAMGRHFRTPHWGVLVVRSNAVGVWNESAHALLSTDTHLAGTLASVAAEVGMLGFGVALDALGATLVACATRGIVIFRDTARTNAWTYAGHAVTTATAFTASLDAAGSIAILGMPLDSTFTKDGGSVRIIVGVADGAPGVRPTLLRQASAQQWVGASVALASGGLVAVAGGPGLDVDGTESVGSAWIRQLQCPCTAERFRLCPSHGACWLPASCAGASPASCSAPLDPTGAGWCSAAPACALDGSTCGSEARCVPDGASHVCTCSVGSVYASRHCVPAAPLCTSHGSTHAARGAGVGDGVTPNAGTGTGPLHFGRAVAMSGAGTVLAIGGSGDSNVTHPTQGGGRVWMFSRTILASGSATAWAVRAEFREGLQGRTAPGLGSAVALRADGNVAIASAYGTADGCAALYVFQRMPEDGSWAAVENATIKVSAPAGASFRVAGGALAMDEAGDVAVLLSTLTGTASPTMLSVVRRDADLGSWAVVQQIGSWSPGVGSFFAGLLGGDPSSLDHPAQHVDLSLSGDGRTVALAAHNGSETGCAVLRRTRQTIFDTEQAIVLNETTLRAQDTDILLKAGTLAYGAALDRTGTMLALSGARALLLLTDRAKRQAWVLEKVHALPAPAYMVDMDYAGSTLVLGLPTNGTAGSVALARNMSAPLADAASVGAQPGAHFGAAVALARSNARFAVASAPSWKAANGSESLAQGWLQSLYATCSRVAGGVTSNGPATMPMDAGAHGCLNVSLLVEYYTSADSVIRISLPRGFRQSHVSAPPVAHFQAACSASNCSQSTTATCAVDTGAQREMLVVSCDLAFALASNATLELQLCGLAVPPFASVGTPSSFRVRMATRADEIVLNESEDLLLPSVRARALDGLRASCVPREAGSNCSLELAFTTENPVPQDGAIVIQLPADLAAGIVQNRSAAFAPTGVSTFTQLLPGASNATIVLTPCTPNPTVFSTAAASVYAAPAVQDGATRVVITITNVGLPSHSLPSVGNISLFTCTSRDAQQRIDKFAPVQGFAVDAAPLRALTATLDNRTAGALANLSLTGVLVNDLPQDSIITVRLPAGFNASYAGAAHMRWNLSALATPPGAAESGATQVRSATASAVPRGSRFALHVTPVKSPSLAGSAGVVAMETRLPDARGAHLVDTGTAAMPELLQPGTVLGPALIVPAGHVFAGEPVILGVQSIPASKGYTLALLCANETLWGTECAAALARPTVVASASAIQITFWDTAPFTLLVRANDTGALVSGAPALFRPLAGLSDVRVAGNESTSALWRHASPVGSERGEMQFSVNVTARLLWSHQSEVLPKIECGLSNASAPSGLQELPGTIVATKPIGSTEESLLTCTLNDTRAFGVFQLQIWLTLDNVAPGSERVRSPARTVRTVALQCAPGFRRLTEVPLCAACPTGTFSNSSGARECMSCAPGTFTELDRAVQCEECPPGSLRAASDGTSASSVCTACPSGKASSRSGAAACDACAPGSYAERPGSLVCVPCERGYFSNTSAARVCQRCNPGAYSGLSNQTGCTLCTPGTFSSSFAATGCTKCASGEYNAQRGATQCFRCPANADCVREGTSLASMRPQEGFWRPNELSLSFYPCATAQACATAGTAAGLLQGGTACADGYAGPACGSCADNYFRRGYQCFACLSTGGTVAMLVVFSAVLLAVAYWAFRPVENVDSAKARMSLAKILIGFVQASTLSQEFEVVWPETYASAQSVLSIFKLDVLQFSSLACVLSTTYYSELVVSVAFPLCVCVFLYMWHLAQMRGGMERTPAKRNLSKNVALVLLLIYPGTTGKAFAFFNCRSIEGVEYLRADYSIECGTREYNAYAVFAALTIAMVSVGIPVYLVWKLASKKSKHSETSMQVKYGALYLDFRPSVKYWEFLRMLHKVLLWVVAAFVAAGEKIFAASIVALAMLLAHGIVSPYEDATKNAFETCVLMIEFISFFMGMAYAGGFVSTDDAAASALLLMLQCLPFLCVAAYGVWSIERVRNAVTARAKVLSRVWNRVRGNHRSASGECSGQAVADSAPAHHIELGGLASRSSSSATHVSLVGSSSRSPLPLSSPLSSPRGNEFSEAATDRNSL